MLVITRRWGSVCVADDSVEGRCRGESHRPSTPDESAVRTSSSNFRSSNFHPGQAEVCPALPRSGPGAAPPRARGRAAGQS